MNNNHFARRLLDKLKFNFNFASYLPIIMQSEHSECGLACIAMIASSHGYEIDLKTLRNKYPVSSRGMGLQKVIDIFNKMKFQSRVMQLDLEEIPELKAPCILHWDLNHYVVLKKANKNKIIIHDPAKGEVSLSYDQASKHFTGIALEVWQAPDFEKKTEKISMKLSDFFNRVKGLKSSLIQLFLLSAILQIFGLITPQFTRFIIDDVIISNDKPMLYVVAIGFLLFNALKIITSTIRSFFIMHLQAPLTLQLSANLFKHLLRLPLDYFEKRHLGDISSRFGAISNIQQIITGTFVSSFIDGILAITTLGMLLVYSVKLTLIVLTFFSIYVLIRLAAYYPLRAINEEQLIIDAKQQTNFLETIRSIQGIKIFNKEIEREQLWQNRFVDSINTGLKSTRLQMVFGVTEEAINSFESIILLIIGALLIMQGQESNFTIGLLMAYTQYSAMFSSHANSLISNYIQLKMVSLHLERLSDIALSDVDSAHSQNSPEDHIPTGKLSIDNLSFRYDDSSPYIFKNISFNIDAGESIAIIGPSGCGKTTLLKILMSLFRQTSGQIFIDNKPLKDINLCLYRKNISSVMQNDSLLSGSIIENITFFDTEANEEFAKQCCAVAGIFNDIAAMPMGFKTLIGDIGICLSAGQQQRLMIARALYAQPKILFMDEATSNLDVNIEAKISENIKQLKITRIIVAHRPETIKTADRILFLTPNGIQEQMQK